MAAIFRTLRAASHSPVTNSLDRSRQRNRAVQARTVTHGLEYGTGVEYAANDWVIVRADRYTDFGTDHFPNDFSGPEAKMNSRLTTCAWASA